MKQLLVIIFILVYISGCTGPNTYVGSVGLDLPIGPELDDRAVMADVGVRHTFELSDHFTTDQEVIIGAIYSKKCRPNISGNIGFTFLFNEEWSIRLAGGATGIYKGGDIDGLASSTLYANMQAGIKWRLYELSVFHISSPFHHGDEGDDGINMLKLTILF